MLRVPETAVAAQVFNMERRIEELEKERLDLTRMLKKAENVVEEQDRVIEGLERDLDAAQAHVEETVADLTRAKDGRAE